jgi:hypothetical protein
VFTFLTSSNILKILILEYITMIYELSHEEQINLYKSRRSNDMCNKLIDYTNENAKNNLKLGRHQNVQGYEKVLEENDTFFKPISSKIVDIGKFISRKYYIEFGTYGNYNHEAIQMRKIHGPTILHTDGPICDTGDKMISVYGLRSLSVIIALNGDYDGGEIVFPCQNFKTKLKQGEAIAFPPYWTHPHYTEDLKNNTFRYTINTWLNF